jgi:hypothetical protein
MPSVQVFVDKSLGLDPAKVGQVAHDAVKNGIGKPDMYITVALKYTMCVWVQCGYCVMCVCVFVCV